MTAKTLDRSHAAGSLIGRGEHFRLSAIPESGSNRLLQSIKSTENVNATLPEPRYFHVDFAVVDFDQGSRAPQ
jgi:hypothetical protein